jgi:hypothetical protein
LQFSPVVLLDMHLVLHQRNTISLHRLGCKPNFPGQGLAKVARRLLYSPAITFPRVEKGRITLSIRKSDLLWFHDMLEHLHECLQQLEWTQDPTAVHFLSDSMLRDLDGCRRLCQNLQRKAAIQSMN